MLSTRHRPLVLVLVTGGAVACSAAAPLGATADGAADAAPGADTGDGRAETGAFPDPCPAAVPDAGSVAAGETCLRPEDCFRAAGEVVLCAASTMADVMAKIERCHRLQGAASGAACAASRAANGIVTESLTNVLGGETLPAQTGLCDARDGLACDRMLHTCEPLVALGAPCDTRACVTGAHCDRAASRCAPPVTIGESCDLSDEFLGASWCDGQSTCDLTTQLCKAALPPGAACQLDFECITHLCRNAVCGPVGAACIP